MLARVALQPYLCVGVCLSAFVALCQATCNTNADCQTNQFCHTYVPSGVNGSRNYTSCASCSLCFDDYYYPSCPSWCLCNSTSDCPQGHHCRRGSRGSACNSCANRCLYGTPLNTEFCPDDCCDWTFPYGEDPRQVGMQFALRSCEPTADLQVYYTLGVASGTVADVESSWTACPRELNTSGGLRWLSFACGGEKVEQHCEVITSSLAVVKTAGNGSKTFVWSPRAADIDRKTDTCHMGTVLLIMIIVGVVLVCCAVGITVTLICCCCGYVVWNKQSQRPLQQQQPAGQGPAVVVVGSPPSKDGWVEAQP